MYMEYQNKPEVYKELLRLLSSYATARNEAHGHITAQVESLFRGTTRPYSTPGCLNSHCSNGSRYTVRCSSRQLGHQPHHENHHREPSSRGFQCEKIEEGVMKMTQSILNNFTGFIVDACLFEGFS